MGVDNSRTWSKKLQVIISFFHSSSCLGHTGAKSIDEYVVEISVADQVIPDGGFFDSM